MMHLVANNSFQIHRSVDHLFDFNIIVQKNRMIQIVSCELDLRHTKYRTRHDINAFMRPDICMNVFHMRELIT